jgi:ribosomal protein S18 acetylase RimI-like enzyme
MVKEHQSIRPLQPGDMPAVKAVIEACGLFPAELLDGMTAGYFGGEAKMDLWLTYDDGIPMAVAYCAPERMTLGTWNLLLIAVDPDRQGKGYGSAIIRHIERTLAANGQRVLLLETSGLPSFERTRLFYKKLGFDLEAVIREFYQAGEDKIIFRKALPPTPEE